MATVEWNGDELARRVAAAASAGVGEAAVHFQGAVQVALSRPGTPTAKDGLSSFRRGEALRSLARGAKKRTNLSKLAREAVRASYSRARLGGLVDPPGGMPRKRSGALARSINIDWSPGALKARIGPDPGIVYAAIQEFGGHVAAKNHPFLTFEVAPGVWRRAKSVNIPARPYMRPTFRAQRGAIESIIKGRIAETLQ